MSSQCVVQTCLKQSFLFLLISDGSGVYLWHAGHDNGDTGGNNDWNKPMPLVNQSGKTLT